MAVVSLWLEPDQAGRQVLDSLVSKAHAMVGGPLVVPHITIRGSIDMEPSEARDLLSSIETAPFEAVLTEIRLGDVWNMALYATAAADALSPLRAQTDKSLGLSAEAYNPHVSFSYGLAPVNKRQAALALIAPFLPLSIRFDTASAWLTECTDEKDVPNWSCIASKTL